MRGDINATELFQDRAFLVRVGLGLMDIPFGSGGTIGFEDIKTFSYVDDEEKDPKHYRRKVFKLVGHYYPNDLAQALWAEFSNYQARLCAETRRPISLEEAAEKWLLANGHNFFKHWALNQKEVPFRLRNAAEPSRGILDIMAVAIAPEWRELFHVGFSLPEVIIAGMRESVRGRSQRYLRIVARLSGHPVKNSGELGKRCQEIRQLQALLTRQTGRAVNLRVATIEYYRRLELVAEFEGKTTTNNPILAFQQW